MSDITWAGTIAGALIAIATVLHWAITRAIRVGTWLAAAVQLPAEVDRLAGSVTQLTGAVQQLALTCQPYHRTDPVEVTR
jgi:hypothetical protein